MYGAAGELANARSCSSAFTVEGSSLVHPSKLTGAAYPPAPAHVLPTGLTSLSTPSSRPRALQPSLRPTDSRRKLRSPLVRFIPRASPSWSDVPRSDQGHRRCVCPPRREWSCSWCQYVPPRILRFQCWIRTRHGTCDPPQERESRRSAQDCDSRQVRRRSSRRATRADSCVSASTWTTELSIPRRPTITL